MSFAIYLDVEIRTSGIGSTIASGFAAAASGLSGAGSGVLRGLGMALASRLAASTVIPTRSIADKMLTDLQAILSRPGTGRIYTTQWRTSRRSGRPFPLANVPTTRSHQASAPGEPPAKDSGDLYDSVTYDIIQGASGPIIRIGTPLMYGLWLEFGMSQNYLPRPWLRILANSMRQGKMVTRGDGYSIVLANTLKRSAAGFLASLFTGGR